MEKEMVFNFAGEYLNGKNLSEKERLEIFSKMVKRQDNIDAKKEAKIMRRERLVTSDELEELYQRHEDANKSWEDIKNECV